MWWRHVEEDIGTEGSGRGGYDGFGILRYIARECYGADASGLSSGVGSFPGVELGFVTTDSDNVACAKDEGKFNRSISIAMNWIMAMIR